MASKKAKQTASTSSANSIPAFPAPPTMPTQTDEHHAITPEQSPAKRTVGLVQAQKQALMENLQLEITERARKLRAQYAMQAQSLHSRLEMRVNRIPQGLRKRKIQDLIDEHAEQARPKPSAPVQVLQEIDPKRQEQIDFEGEKKALKRNSDRMLDDGDKENMASESAQDLANPKKRTKTTATANSKAVRAASRKDAPSTVLSPKSHNSRTLPRSPFKSGPAQEKAPAVARPTSPLKSTTVAAAKAPARAPTRQTKRKGAATAASSDQENNGRASEASNTSASTTIVSKIVAKAKATGKRAAATKTTASAAAKRTAPAVKKEAAPATSTTAGGRTLRKRG